jgi:hypothetical protein
MKDAEEEKIHALALELHELLSRATRAGLKKHPDGRDDSAERAADLRETVIDELEWRVLEVSADLFELSGDRDTSEEVRESIAEALRCTAAARKSSRVCEGCGCTDFLACPGGCSWTSDRRCSRCDGRRRVQAAARGARTPQRARR